VIESALALANRAALLARAAWFWLWYPQTVGVRVLVLRHPLDEPEVLLVRHRAGRRPWELPGGAIGRREPIAEAARREVLEESGAQIRVERLHGAFDNFGYRRSDIVLVLVASPLSEPHPRRSLEIAEARYFPLDQLPTQQLGHGSRRCIAEWQRGEHGTLGVWDAPELPPDGAGSG